MQKPLLPVPRSRASWLGSNITAKRSAAIASLPNLTALRMLLETFGKLCASIAQFDCLVAEEARVAAEAEALTAKAQDLMTRREEIR